MLIGLGVVLLGVVVMGPMMFGHRQEPATVPVRSGVSHRGAAPQRAVWQPSRRVSTRPTWIVRLRGVIGLMAVSAGIAAFLAIVVGGAVFALGLALQR